MLIQFDRYGQEEEEDMHRLRHYDFNGDMYEYREDLLLIISFDMFLFFAPKFCIKYLLQKKSFLERWLFLFNACRFRRR